MEIRGPKASDIPQLRELCDKYSHAGFDLPSKHNIFADAIVEHNGRILAYGIVKMIAEAILIMDHALPVKERGDAITLLIQEAVRQTSKKQLLELQAVCEPKFAGVMKKHYGFQQVTGELLVLDI